MKFKETCEFNGDSAEVWARASNLEAIPRYWHGTKVFRVTRRGQLRSTADVVFAFGGKGRAKATVDEGDKTVTIHYVEGPFER